MYGEYPSLDPADQLSGDMHFNNDFRSIYSTVLDDWLGMQPDPIVNGSFEKFEEILLTVKEVDSHLVLDFIPRENGIRKSNGPNSGIIV